MLLILLKNRCMHNISAGKMAYAISLRFYSADKEGELTVQSNVNTAKAGSYYVDYIVNAGAISGKSRLVVVVQ